MTTMYNGKKGKQRKYNKYDLMKMRRQYITNYSQESTATNRERCFPVSMIISACMIIKFHLLT